MKIVVPLMLIAVGGVSNTIDRITLGYVRDPLHIGSLYFNYADISIAIGTIIAIAMIYKQKIRV